MSVNASDMDNDSDMELNYSDLEIINVSINGKLDSGGGFDSFSAVDPLDEELERNQVGELIAYELNIRTEGGILEFGLGYNVADNDFVEQAASNLTDFKLDGGDTNVAIYEEPGIIDFNEVGGAEQVQNAQLDKFKNFRHEFGTGPFVDSTDDLDIHLEAKNQSGKTTRYGIQAQLYYKVHEVAQGIPQFSDPRRLMD